MTDEPRGPLAVLARIRRGATAPVVPAGERCDLCGELLDDEHGHLVDVESRALRCSCRACYLLFTAGGTRLRSVPDRYVSFPDVQLSAAQWDAFQIPVGVAFFFLNSSLSRVVALYPSPAGATESLLPLDAWSELERTYPEVAAMAPDVEALLMHAERGDAGPECYLVPIDACYELVGRLRTTWRGFDGGADARAELATFFARVRARATPASGGRPSPPEASP
jgi:hypothetical protein